MLNFFKGKYASIFPARQVLLRQNGEVKYVSVSSKVQLSLTLIALSFVAWFAYSNYQNVSLNQQIDQAQSKISKSQQDMDNLSETYQTKHITIQDQLKQVQAQQELLHNLVESLPESIATDSSSQVQSIPAKADVNTSASNSVSKLAPTELFEQMDETAQQLAKLEKSQLDSYHALYSQVETRHQELSNALIAAGFNQEVILDNAPEGLLAQGGPLLEVANDVTSLDKSQLITKLLDLIKLEGAMANLPITFPAKKYYISSRYGIRTDPIRKRPAMHKGIDMAGWIKTKIYSPANGIVKRAGRNGSYGNFIEIDHQNGFSTRYGHLNRIKVKKGQVVTKGDTIGLMGNSGRSTSTHLHYEILFNNKQINPLKFIKVLQDVL